MDVAVGLGVDVGIGPPTPPVGTGVDVRAGGVVGTTTCVGRTGVLVGAGAFVAVGGIAVGATAVGSGHG